MAPRNIVEPSRSRLRLSQESLVEAPGPHGPLQGTMLAPPTSGAPVVLIIPGSGPTDRDGNSPLGVRASTYRLFAEGLAERGIASLRVDKRGLFGSDRAVPDANAVTINDYAADVHTWADWIRMKTGVPGVWVLGHSEGGLVALSAAQKAPGLCGLVLASTAGRPMGDVLREQLAHLPSMPQAEVVISHLEAGQRVDMSEIPHELWPVFRADVQDFLMSSFALDPAKLIASIRQPTLILQGLKDLQVGQADAERLHSARPDARLVLFDEVNHVFKRVASDDRLENIAAYQDPDRPIAPGVVDAIAEFIKGR